MKARELETRVTEVEKPLTVEVDVTPSEKTIVAGLEETVVRNKKDPGFDLRFGICTRCGESIAIKIDRLGKRTHLGCPICKSTDLEAFRQTEQTIKHDKVEDIINREVVYKDPKTGFTTKDPFADSQLNEDLAAYTDKWQRGFLCSNCRRIYTKKLKVCCSDGKIISGKFMLDPSGLKRDLAGAI